MFKVPEVKPKKGLSKAPHYNIKTAENFWESIYLIHLKILPVPLNN